MYRKYNFVIMLMALKRENGKGIIGTYVLYDFYNFSERKIMVYVPLLNLLAVRKHTIIEVISLQPLLKNIFDNYLSNTCTCMWKYVLKNMIHSCNKKKLWLYTIP